MLRATRLASKLKITKRDETLVSIIIATYNRSQILVERTIPSLLSQTHKNLEIVIIGDCCIDDTAERLKNVLDPRVRFYDLKRRTLYPKNPRDRWFVQGTTPRNIGLRLARGSWYVFISDDDILYPHHLETMLNHAVRNNCEFVSAAYKTIKNGIEINVFPSANNFKSKLICGGMQTWLYTHRLKFFKWNKNSWRKKYDRPCDYDLQQRFYRSGVKMDHFDDIVFYSPAVGNTNTTGLDAALATDES